MTTTTSTYTFETISADDLSATDLRNAVENGTSHPVGFGFEIARVWIGDKAEPAFAIYSEELSRGAVAWGADAQWTDCTSINDCIDRFLNDDMVS